MNSKLTIKNQDNGTIDLLINGQIDEYFGENLQNVVQQITDSKASVINVQINSGGGSVMEGQAIANYLKGSKAFVKTSGLGFVGSIATVILLAGRKVTMADNSYFMIHNPTAGLYGESEELRKTADLLDTIQDDLANIYTDAIAKNGKLVDGDYDKTKKKVKKMMDAETWLTAKQALEEGFIDEVTDGVTFVNKLQATEILNSCKAYKNAPTEFLNNIQKVINMAENATTPTFWEQFKALFTSNKGEVKALLAEVQKEAENEELQEIEKAKELAKKHGFYKEVEQVVETVEKPTEQAPIVQNNVETEKLEQRIKELEERLAAPSTGSDKTESIENKQKTREQILAPDAATKEAISNFVTIFKR